MNSNTCSVCHEHAEATVGDRVAVLLGYGTLRHTDSDICAKNLRRQAWELVNGKSESK